MAVEAMFRTTGSDFPLTAVFSEFPNAEIELDRVVPTDTLIIPYLWVIDVDTKRLSMENVAHPGIRDIRVVDNVNGAAFIRIDLDLSYESILTAIVESDVSLIAARGTEDHWTFQLRAESHEQIVAFQSCCHDHDLPMELTQIHTLTPFASDQPYELTDTQREAMMVAYTLGYYDSPRTVTREAVAEELGITPQALGSRLQRGTRRLISNTIIGFNH